MIFADSDALCAHIAAEHNTVILSFSRGKDSIAAWLQLRRYGLRIIPVHLYLVPSIEFVDESLKYYEDFFQTTIYNLPHPGLYRWLRNFTFQAPERLRTIEESGLPKKYDYDELFAYIRRKQSLPPVAPVGVGVTQNDSPNRRASIKRFGPVNRKRQQFYPIFDWNKARIIQEIDESGVSLPVDYELFGRSWDGLDYRFLKPISERFPADYARILELFPMAEIELLRMEWRAKHAHA